MGIKKIVTIGYEGASLDDFLATLQAAGVDVLLDIRELAISRRKGFSKNALREGLESAGIGYQHEPKLGSPGDIRNSLRETGDYTKFFRDFDKYLKTQSELLNDVVQQVNGTVALLCYERDFNLCHRRSVATVLGEIASLKPRHLGVQNHAQRQAVKDSRSNSRQSVSST